MKAKDLIDTLQGYEDFDVVVDAVYEAGLMWHMLILKKGILEHSVPLYPTKEQKPIKIDIL